MTTLGSIPCAKTKVAIMSLCCLHQGQRIIQIGNFSNIQILDVILESGLMKQLQRLVVGDHSADEGVSNMVKKATSSQIAYGWTINAQ